MSALSGIGTKSVPNWYRSRMSVQIAVRLPEELVSFIDSEVESGNGASRAAIVYRALDRERRRRLAERDAEILAQNKSHELDGLARFTAELPSDT